MVSAHTLYSIINITIIVMLTIIVYYLAYSLTWRDITAACANYCRPMILFPPPPSPPWKDCSTNRGYISTAHLAQ